jgi:hypothetical protein
MRLAPVGCPVRAVPGLAIALALAVGCDPGTVNGRGDSGGGRTDTGTGGPVDAGPPDPGTDGDGDTITDAQEDGGAVDTDVDGVPDASDEDSDGDGISDRDEAGDADPTTRPIDTDGDGRGDFRDLDSDGDGLPDADEVAAGSDPREPDSDGDGVTDLVEVAAMTDPRDAADSPRARGDFFFLVPYMGAPVPTRDTLVFATNLQRADVHFMIDTSISMQGYIDTVRTSLTTTVIPGVTASIPDVQFGVGQFDVCPQSTHRAGDCRGIEQNQTSTADAAAVNTALASLTADCSPVHEPYAQAAWVWATGDTTRWPRMTAPACPPGAVGLGCVREGALPILVMIGDEPFRESYNVAGTPCASGACSTCAMFPSSMEMIDAFGAIRGRLLVLGPTGTSTEWAPVVTGTGAVDAMGAPLIFPDAGEATVDAAVVDAIRTLARSTPLDITARPRDADDGDGVDATIFIERIEPNTAGGVMDPRDPTVVCVGGLPTADTDMDGVPDTFPDVRPGTPVCFDIVPRTNTTVMPTSAPQLFRALVDVVGDGVTVLDTRDVYFVVPPEGGDIPS